MEPKQPNSPSFSYICTKWPKDGIKNLDMEKAVKNYAEFGNRCLSKAKTSSIRCLRGIQAMCIQILYQIGIHTFRANQQEIFNAAHEKEGELKKVYSLLRWSLLTNIMGKAYGSPIVLAKALQVQLGYGMFCKHLYNVVQTHPMKKRVAKKKRKVLSDEEEEDENDVLEELRSFRKEMEAEYKEMKSMVEKVLERIPREEETFVGASSLVASHPGNDGDSKEVPIVCSKGSERNTDKEEEDKKRPAIELKQSNRSTEDPGRGTAHQKSGSKKDGEPSKPHHQIR